MAWPKSRMDDPCECVPRTVGVKQRTELTHPPVLVDEGSCQK